MKYLIKLEDRRKSREVTIECPARITLEDLNCKIKSEFHLPCTGERGHYFQMNGKVYVTDHAIIQKIWGNYGDVWFPLSFDIQRRINYPREKDVRMSWRFNLSQVFTTKGSVIVFVQENYSDGYEIRCTLIDRIE